MDKFLCWYANHWFISFILLGFILGYIARHAGFSEQMGSLNGFVFSIIMQLCIVKGIGYSSLGEKCLKIERDNLQKKANVLSARLG